MSIHNFIFSAQRNQRIKRHVLLWIACYIFNLTSFPPSTSYGSVNGLSADGFYQYYEMVMIRVFFYLLCQLAFFYILVYFLMPVFFWKKKYLQFICMLLILVTAVSFFRYAILLYIYNPIMKELKLYVNSVQDILRASIILNFDGPAFLILALISLKFFKDWQQKQTDNFNLQKENTNAELQLLKAQIHPHFLFNTLNNIYSFTLIKSQYAKYLVKKLEGMLYYMVEECDQPLVPLSKEINLINDYLELEKVRYGNRLKTEVTIIANNKDKIIAPLLMIPFVENSFKHGTSKMLRNPWIKLYIQADEHVLHFTLANSKPTDKVVNTKSGIGLSNVKKRLGLLYPENHHLQIESTINTFTVNMQIPLQEINTMAEMNY